jgi:hypothetical protein
MKLLNIKPVKSGSQALRFTQTNLQRMKENAVNWEAAVVNLFYLITINVKP